jgi:hypothetical protein
MSHFSQGRSDDGDTVLCAHLDAESANACCVKRVDASGEDYQHQGICYWVLNKVSSTKKLYVTEVDGCDYPL